MDSVFVVIAAGAAGHGVTEPTDEIGKGAAVDKSAGGTAAEEVALEGGTGVLPSRMEDVEATVDSLGGSEPSDAACIDSEVTSDGYIAA